MHFSNASFEERDLGQWSVGLTCQLQKGSGTRVHIPELYTGLFTGGEGGSILIWNNYPILVVLKHTFHAEISAIHLDSNFYNVHIILL